MTRDDPELERLVAAIAAGDRAALGTLYDMLAGSLIGLATRFLGDSREAEDLVQDVLLEVWKQAGTYDPKRANVRSWIVMRLRSRAIDRRRSVAGKHVPTEPTLFDRENEDEADATLTPDFQRIRAVLRTLPEAQRTAMELAWIGGYTSSEIAELEGVPIGTVKSRIRFAMAALRDALLPEGSS
ncbi:MAG: sigma-70 family RNA polymerase sigma factor [Polyangiales bacterium]